MLLTKYVEMYKFYNANKHGRYVNDCTIRAISLAEGKSWQETYDELSYLAGKNGIILDDVNFIEPLLDSRYRRVHIKEKYVGEFANNHPRGVYIIAVRSHLTCCVDGCIYDTFNPLGRKILKAWKVA